ncbi:MAG TPA: hypothetical protein VGB18_08385 [Candidatus Thermoplasmatota archaeon]
MQRLDAVTARPVIDEVEKRGNRKLASELAKGSRILVLDDHNGLHLVTPKSLPLAMNAMTPDAFGEPWGTFMDGIWTPSLAAMVRVGAATQYRRIVIEDAAAQHFLYSKGVHKPGIVERDPALRVGDEAWVTDKKHNVLGRAKILQPTQKLLDMLRPLDDLGWYLREGG